MTPHLLFLWCVGTMIPQMMPHIRCDQSVAVKVMDAGPLYAGEDCALAMGRWIESKQTVSVGDGQILDVVCEVPR